jgi:hypothetical protein
LGTGTGLLRAAQGISRKRSTRAPEAHRSWENKAGSRPLEPSAEDEILHGKEGVDDSSPSMMFKPPTLGEHTLVVFATETASH